MGRTSKAVASPVKRRTHANGGTQASTATTPLSSISTEDSLPSERIEWIESTVVSRENATHLAFARSRTQEFVYAVSNQYLRLVNDYASDTDRTGSSSSLLVVVGPPGTGKSSLLAHFAAHRRSSDHDSAIDFVYEHYGGCSYDSVKLSLFLFRLMNQLKTTFGLRDFELPHEHEEEKLKFSFARCLEAAVSRRKKSVGASGSTHKRLNIILILDGIDCIRTEDGGDSLSWLPNTFPVGVRVIVSATHSLSYASVQNARAVKRKPAAYDYDGDLIYDTTLPPSDSDSHTIRELRRRHAAFIVVEPLDESSCRALINLYGQSGTTPLTDEEIEALVNAPGSANPLVVRLILQGQELFERDSEARRVWLETVMKSGELHVIYEQLIRRWNDILLEDLREELFKLTNRFSDNGHENISPPKLTKRATKRDVGIDVEELNTKSNQSRTLTRVPSVRSPAPVSNTAPDRSDIEALQTTMEQRALLVRHALSLFSVARYGLSEVDLQRLLGDTIPIIVYKLLWSLLRPHLMPIHRRDCIQDGDQEVILYDISHNQLRLLIRYGFLSDEALRGCYYKELANYFGALDVSQRRVDELPVQLERCGLWSALQNCLVDIKMFQLWWSERNRQELFCYWMVLRSNCAIHDPVDDFVKSLDDFINHEAPTPEQLLSLCLTITDFLRTWQRIGDSRSGSLTLTRPAPPQLDEFIASLGGCSHLSEAEIRKVQSEIDALCIHKDDAYFVKRWLWTQFPLIGYAFECRFLRSLSSTRLPESSSSEKNEDTVDGSIHGSDASFSPSVSKSPTRATSSQSKPATGTLPKSLQNTATKALLQVSKRKPSLLFSSKETSNLAFDPIPAIGEENTFEFLSAENAEAHVGSVSKFETMLVDLRVRHDKLKFMAKEKQDALQVLDSRVLDMKAQAQSAGQNASQVVGLMDQIRHVGDETVAGRQRSDYYKAILRQCEIRPARDPNVIEVTETTVNRLKQEIVELQQKTQVVSYETRLASIERKKLQQVVEDTQETHTAALARLRWRHELMQRVLNRQRGDAPSETDPDVNSDADDDESDQLSSGAEDGDDDVATSNGDNQRSQKSRNRRRTTLADDPQFNRVRDKLLHKKETTIERLRKVESLKVYIGSTYKDDGVLGSLRQVGINKPEEAHLYWQDQIQHAAQLEEQEKSLEMRVNEYRDQLAELQAHLLNLKLGGSRAGNTSSEASGAEPSQNVSHGITEHATGGAGAPVASATHNIKQLEQHLTEASAITQQKKERASRLKSLSKRLHLGLHHVAHILGVASTQTMDPIELADAVEQVVRVYLGDEGHMQSGSSSNLRRKNSVRAMGMTSQGGSHGVILPDTRSPEEKIRFNVRVNRSPQRQTNPYVEGDAFHENGAGDDEEEEDEDDNNRETMSHDGVVRRGDIKQRCRMEVDRKLRVAAAGKTGKNTSDKVAKGSIKRQLET